jgi:hypothetical protein
MYRDAEKTNYNTYRIPFPEGIHINRKQIISGTPKPRRSFTLFDSESLTGYNPLYLIYFVSHNNLYPYITNNKNK